MKKKRKPEKLGVVRVGSFFVLGVVSGVMGLICVARLTWHSKFYPGVTVAGVEIAGMNRELAKLKLTEITQNYQTKLTFNGSSWETPKEAVKFEIEASLNEAYRYGRRFQIGDYLLLLINKKTNFPLVMAEGKTESREKYVFQIAEAIEIPPIEPTIEMVENKIRVINGSDGIVLDEVELERRIRERYSQLGTEVIGIPTKIAERQLSTEKLDQLKARAEILVKKKLQLTLDDERIQLEGAELIHFLDTTGSGEEIDRKVIGEYVLGLGDSLNRVPQDAKFEFVEGKVKEFAPGKEGVEVKTQETSTSVTIAVRKLLLEESKEEIVEIAVVRTPPKITTDKVNELGIRERIGRGESYYAHSIANRIYNVGLASSRANSTLIPPGEEFSFNRAVGEITGASGYRQAYVISGGRTVLDDGGGVCQVSTTIFRAALNSGLPIIERWAHAYRVGYYEQNSKPGIDATVYSPSKDLRFRNDTPGHILVQLTNDPKKLHLVVEIYGTSDGRVATMTEPKVWGVSPPPPDVIQDDPTLPAGTMQQVDWAAWGAKTSFEYKVMRNGELLYEKTFNSNFKPWANVYLKGTMGQ